MGPAVQGGMPLMNRRLVSLVAVLGVGIALSGCQGNRQMQQDIVNLQNTTKKQLDLLKQQNEFLNRKMNTVNTNVATLTEKTDQLSAELSTYANRPEEVKLEIISEVNTRFEAIAAQNKEFQDEVNANFKGQQEQIDLKLQTQLDLMTKTLDKHTAFVNFVATEQDSINRVFANRFDSRPWYQSIIGKWDDRERAQKNNP